MKKLLLLAVVLMSGSAMAGEWTYLSSEEATEGRYYKGTYLKPKVRVDQYVGIPKTGYAKHIVTVEILYDSVDAKIVNNSHNKPITTHKYYSLIYTHTVDCIAGKYDWGTIGKYMSERMGKGIPVIPAYEWQWGLMKWDVINPYDKQLTQAMVKCSENGYPIDANVQSKKFMEQFD